jgi:hypothetical protein
MRYGKNALLFGLSNWILTAIAFTQTRTKEQRISLGSYRSASTILHNGNYLLSVRALFKPEGHSLFSKGIGAGQTQTISPANTTTYTITVADANYYTYSDQVTMTVNPLPIANAGADQAICAGQSATLSATGGSAYQWSNGIGAGQTQTISTANTTTYSTLFIAGSARRCSDTSCNSAKVVQKTFNTTHSIKWELHPQPAHERIFLFSSIDLQDAMLVLCNATGKNAMEWSQTFPSNQPHGLTFPNQHSGIFFMEVQTRDLHFSQRFIVQ